MNRIGLLGVLSALLFALPVRGEIFVLEPGFGGQDSSYYSFIPLLVRGQYNTLYSQTASDDDGFSHSMRTHLRFALPEDLLGEGETVHQALLLMVYAFSFDHSEDPPDVPANLTVHRINDDWHEDSLYYENAPSIGPGIETIADITDFGTLEFDVTSLVREWAEGTRPNYGFALTNTSERPIGFHSWESGVSSDLKNVLVVTTGQGSSESTGTNITIALATPDFDRWMYPFNATPGFRNLASTFGSLMDVEFDNRDGTLALGFDTKAAGIPAGLGAASYTIESATVTATHFFGDFEYDGTADPWQTYLDPLAPEYVADADTGRPIEIHGLGLRNGYTALELGAGAAGAPGFEEGEAFDAGGEMAKETRNLFPLAFGVPNPEGDVSNNLDGGFDSAPWGIGRTTSGLAPGDPVPEGVPGVSAGETFEFEIDVADPDVQAYLQAALDEGTLGFVISSLHDTVQMAGGSNPNFYSKDNFDPAAIPPTLEIEVTYVPEPSAALQLISGLLLLLGLARHRRRVS